MRDDLGASEYAHSLHGQQVRVSRADPDADQLSRTVHRPGRARPFTAAAVIALPPARPRTAMKGTPRESAMSASFDSAAPMNPTGIPKIAAGRGAPRSSNSSSRNSEVGA